MDQGPMGPMGPMEGGCGGRMHHHRRGFGPPMQRDAYGQGYPDEYQYDGESAQPGGTAGDALAAQGLQLLKAGDQYGGIMTLLAANQADPGLMQDPNFLHNLQIVESQQGIADPGMVPYQSPEMNGGGIDPRIYANIQNNSAALDSGVYAQTDAAQDPGIYANPQTGGDAALQAQNYAAPQTGSDAAALQAQNYAAPQTDATAVPTAQDSTAQTGQPSEQTMAMVQQAVQAFQKGDSATGALAFMQAATMDPTLVNNPDFLKNFKQFFGAGATDATASNGTQAVTTPDASTATASPDGSMARTSQDTVVPNTAQPTDTTGQQAVAPTTDATGQQTVATSDGSAANPQQMSIQLISQAFQLIQSGDQADGILTLMKAAMLNPQILQDQNFLQQLVAVEKSANPAPVGTDATTSSATTQSDASVQPTDASQTGATSLPVDTTSMSTTASVVPTTDTSSAPTDTTASSTPVDTSTTDSTSTG